jgi:tetratricopeptide (TPR) repeat protein
VTRAWNTSPISGMARRLLAGIRHMPILMGLTTASSAPEQWPTLMAGLVGRDTEVARLLAGLDPASKASTGIIGMVGSAGVGKTALAVEAARAGLLQGWFGKVLFTSAVHPGGTFAPAEMLEETLIVLGVPGQYIPADSNERASLYRAVLARTDDAVLVIVDDATSEAQVRPLLPGDKRHKVLVASREPLADLGAQLVDVAALDDSASIALLDAALRAADPGDSRVIDELDAARKLAAMCGGSPLALLIVAAMLKDVPALRAETLADELAADRLEQSGDDSATTMAPRSLAVVSGVACRKLGGEPARMFRLLSVIPRLEVSAVTAAVLAGIPATSARAAIESLLRACLAEVTPGAAGRWRLPDVLRPYAEVLAEQADPAEREQARDRLLDYYLTTAEAADPWLRGQPGIHANFTGEAQAFAWLDAEYPTIEAAITMAATTGRAKTALRLSLWLVEYFRRQQRFDRWLATAAVGMDIARRIGDRHGEGVALDTLGLALASAGRYDEAITAHKAAVDVFNDDHRRELGGALVNLSIALRESGRVDDAINSAANAVAVEQEIGDRHGEGVALDTLGLALASAGRYDEAITAHKEAAVVFGDTGDHHRETQAVQHLEAASAAQQTWD